MSHPEFQKAAPAGPGADFYALLGLEERYAVDLAALERHYLERSRAVHPDRFVNAEAAERVRALQRSMQLNDAYRTLHKPARRAEYLLARHGVTIGDNETLDPTFLMEILELREELAEAKQARAMARLRQLEDAMLDRRDATLDQVAERFTAFEQGGDRAVLGDIKAKVILLRYIQRYLDELEGVFDDEDES